jgi:hypothetical protein
MRWAPATALVVLGLVSLCSAAAPGRSAVSPDPRVTVIGDSILTAVMWNFEPRAIVQRSLAVRWDVEICRRLTGESCPFDGAEAPNFVDTVERLGSDLGPTVVVEMGYNDYADSFATSVEQAVQALLAAGVQHILWLSLREAQGQFVAMNQVLEDAARRHPEMTIVDWNLLSANHPEWFQTDSLHLRYAGAIAMASLIHDAIERSLVPPPAVVPERLPSGHAGRRYAALLLSRGGIAPVRWSLVSGSLPRGLRLLATGRIAGVPLRRARASFVVCATDARGERSVRREVLVVGA